MTDTETAARLRAAFAFAAPTLDKKARANILGVSERTVGRWQTKGGQLSPEQLDRIVEETGVPLWFLLNGFDAPPEPEEPTIRERLEAVEHQVSALYQALREARGERLGEDLDAIFAEHVPTPETPAQHDPQDGPKQGPGAGHPAQTAPAVTPS